MKISKASVAEVVSKLSDRAKDLFLAMANHKTFEFASEKEHGELITELIIAKLIRCDWNILTNEQIFVLNHSSRFIVLVLNQLREKAA